MSCNDPGATHHLACDCREAEWAAKLAKAEERAAGLSRELLAAIQARDREREARRAAEEATANHQDDALRCVKAEAEAERLRKALRKITGSALTWEDADRLARAALAAEEGK